MLWLVIIVLILVVIAILNHRDSKKWSKILGYKPTSDELTIIINLESEKYPQSEIIQILQAFKSKTLDKKAIKELIKERKRKLKQQEANKLATKNREREIKYQAKQQELKDKLKEIEAKRQALKSMQSIKEDEVLEAEIIQEYPDDTPIEIIDYYEKREFDAMRFALQKVAYEMVGDRYTQQEKDKFKKIMTYFAYKDPLYNDCIKRVISIVAKNEGMLQTQIYPYFKEYDTEIIRYVLYFGSESGDIHRLKSGRTYKLYTRT
jgi:hypothetical protein|nr:MAG TPA: hypothetical protein [Caudoviricetes sp.]